MNKLFTDALKVRNLFGTAIFSLILVYLFKDTIQKLALAGDAGNLNLLLGFLSFMVIGVLGMTAYFAIAEKEIQGEKGRPIARVEDSEDVEGKQTGSDGIIDVKGSKGVKLTQEGNTEASAEKKT